MTQASASQQLQIQLFETFTLSANGTALTKLNQRERCQSLLGYLIIHSGQDIPRAKLAFQLWPDSSDSQALTNLRRELHYLKRDLPGYEACLSISNKTLRWNSEAPCTIDVSDFETSLQQAREAQQSGDLGSQCNALEQAAQHYQGQLLPHLYDEWIPPEQERLQQRATQGLLALVEGLQQQGKHRQAIRYAQQVLRLDNLNEAGHIHLIQLHALSGDRATALRLYHHCMTLFMEELGVDPSAALQKVYDNLLNEPEPAVEIQAVAETPAQSQAESSLQEAPVSSTLTASADVTRTDWGAAVDTALFYGRQDELATLSNWVDRDRCRLIAILAMGGMGKTMLSVKLAEQMAEQLTAEGTPNFDCVVWRSLRYATPFNDFAKDLLGSLSNQTETQPSPARLAHWLRESRCLIVLDNLETILQGGEEAGYFRPGYEGYGELLRLFAEGSHQSCLILTSREKPAEVGAFEGMDLPVRSLQLQGSAEVAEAILQTKGLVGTAAEKRKLSDRYDNIPLAVKIIASAIQELFDGEIEPFLAEEAFLFNGLRRLLDQQFERLSQLEQSVMFWLAINHEGTSIGELAEDLSPTVPRTNILSALKSLRWRSLIQKQQGLYNQQPAITEYVIEKLVTQVSDFLGQLSDIPESGNSDPLGHNPVHSHALLKATAQDYLQDLQRRLILCPIVQRLKNSQGGKLAAHLQRWVEQWQLQAPGQISYAPGNLINLLSTAQIDLTGWDFSTLQIRQAQLQNLPLHQVNFSHCDLTSSVFATTLSAILDLDWSPNGELLATADVEGQVRLWQAQDGQLLQALSGHSNWVHCLAFSPDGQQIASGSEDAEIFLWDVSTGTVQQRLRGHDSRVWSVAYRPEAEAPLLASGSEDGTVRLWDLETSEALQTLTGHKAGVNAVAWISDRQFLSASSDKTLRLWSIEGDCLAVLSGHEQGIWSLAVHRLDRSGSLLIASGSQDGVIRLWHLPTLPAQDSSQAQNLEPFAKLQTPSRWIWSLGFDCRGQCLASGHDDGSIYLWQTGLILKTLSKSGSSKTMQAQLQSSNQVLQGHQSRVWGLAFSPGGDSLVSGSKDQSLHFWDMERRVSSRTLKGYTNWVQAIAISPDGKTLLSAHEDTNLRQWDLETGELKQLLQGHSQPVWAIAISPDSQLCASSGEDEIVNLWDLEQGKRQATLPGKQGRIWSAAFSQTGQLLAFGGGSNAIRIWDLDAQDFQASLKGHSSRIWSIAFSPNSQQLASSSSDGTVRLWSIATGECLATLTGHKGWVFSVAWSPDGTTLVSSGSDGTLRLWDSARHQALAVLPSKTKLMLSAQFSPDGTLIASGSDDHLVRLWNVETQDCISTYRGHQGWIWSIAFSPDGTRLYSGSQDTTVQQWDVETGRRLQSFRPTRPYEGMNLTGTTGLTPGQQETLISLGGIIK